jgi:hypothetical protein
MNKTISKPVRTDISRLFFRWLAIDPLEKCPKSGKEDLALCRNFVLSVLVSEAAPEDIVNVTACADFGYSELTPAQQLDALCGLDTSTLTPEQLLAYVAAVQKAAGQAALVRWSRATGLGHDILNFMKGYPVTATNRGNVCYSID